MSTFTNEEITFVFFVSRIKWFLWPPWKRRKVKRKNTKEFKKTFLFLFESKQFVELRSEEKEKS